MAIVAMRVMVRMVAGIGMVVAVMMLVAMLMTMTMVVVVVVVVAMTMVMAVGRRCGLAPDQGLLRRVMGRIPVDPRLAQIATADAAHGSLPFRCRARGTIPRPSVPPQCAAAAAPFSSRRVSSRIRCMIFFSSS